MVTVRSLVRIEVKPDKVDEIEALLKGAAVQVQDDVSTTAWFAFRLGPTTVGVFDAFPDDTGRDAHWAAYGEALRARAPELFDGTPPSITWT